MNARIYSINNVLFYYIHRAHKVIVVSLCIRKVKLITICVHKFHVHKLSVLIIGMEPSTQRNINERQFQSAIKDISYNASIQLQTPSGLLEHSFGL